MSSSPSATCPGGPAPGSPRRAGPDPGSEAMPETDRDWWRRFFEQDGAIELSCFPTATETLSEVEGVIRFLDLRQSDTILDVCCGPGRHLLGLAWRGHRVVGLDIALAMVKTARRGLRARKAPGEVVRGEAQRLPFHDGALDHVLHLFNSFGYMDSDEENFAALAEATRCLRPSGRLLLETRNRDLQLTAVPVRVGVRLPGGRRGVMHCAWEPVRQRLTSRWYAGDGSGRLLHYASIRMYTLDEWRAMFRRAGLQLLGVYGDYGGRKFRPTDRQLIFLCERPASGCPDHGGHSAQMDRNSSVDR